MNLEIKSLQKHPSTSNLFFTPDDLRWATPKIVADYRAERLKCKTIADLGCGIGFQTFSFAEKCKKVYAVEKDARKLDCARKNAAVLGLKNIEFIRGDVLDSMVVKKVHDAQIIFCDPERLPSEKQRSVGSIMPSIPELLKIYSKITDNIAIEFPPQIQEIPFDCEREYIAIDGELNRLTLYFGALKKAERSAVVLPGGEVLAGKPVKSEQKSAEAWKYLYEVDPAVVKAELAGLLQEKTKLSFLMQEKFVLLTGRKLLESPFFKNRFEVLSVVPFETQRVQKALTSVNAGKVILRIPLDPAEYWAVRKAFEGKGERKVHLFRVGGMAVVGELL